MSARAKDWLTTGQAADLCHVERDTVLKWIKRGKLPAERTAGGHHRIARSELDRFLLERRRPGGAARKTYVQREFTSRPLHCWEYLAEHGRIRDGCKRCTVYRVQAARCFELLRFGCDIGHRRLFCRGSCEDCSYYRRLMGLPTRVLVVTRRESQMRRLWQASADDLEFRFARNGYEAARQVGEFRPAFVVVESGSGGEDVEELLDCLAADTRSPGMRVVLATRRQRTAGEWRRPRLAGVLRDGFDADDIRELVAQAPVETDTETARLGIVEPKFG